MSPSGWLGRSTMVTSFLCIDSTIGTPAANPRRVTVRSLWLFRRKDLNRIHNSRHSDPARHRGHSVVNGIEHFLARSAHHYLAGEGVDLLDPELSQTLAHSRRRGLGPPVPLLVLEHSNRHDRSVA